MIQLLHSSWSNLHRVTLDHDFECMVAVLLSDAGVFHFANAMILWFILGKPQFVETMVLSSYRRHRSQEARTRHRKHQPRTHDRSPKPLSIFT